MWSIIVFLIVGIVLGNRLNLNEKGKHINGKIQQVGLLLLLFSMEYLLEPTRMFSEILIQSAFKHSCLQRSQL